MKKSTIKYIIISTVVVLVLILVFLIYKNIFAGSNNSRYNEIDRYVLTNDEKNSIKTKINELEDVEKIDIHIDSKIIKIIVTLNKDIDFDTIKAKSDELISSFNKDNLSYYDIEIYIDSKNSESEIYPQIGYKFKTKENFSW